DGLRLQVLQGHRAADRLRERPEWLGDAVYRQLRRRRGYWLWRRAGLAAAALGRAHPRLEPAVLHSDGQLDCIRRHMGGQRRFRGARRRGLEHRWSAVDQLEQCLWSEWN